MIDKSKFILAREAAELLTSTTDFGRECDKLELKCMTAAAQLHLNHSYAKASFDKKYSEKFAHDPRKDAYEGELQKIASQILIQKMDAYIINPGDPQCLDSISKYSNALQSIKAWLTKRLDTRPHVRTLKVNVLHKEKTGKLINRNPEFYRWEQHVYIEIPESLPGRGTLNESSNENSSNLEVNHGKNAGDKASRGGRPAHQTREYWEPEAKKFIRKHARNVSVDSNCPTKKEVCKGVEEALKVIFPTVKVNPETIERSLNNIFKNELRLLWKEERKQALAEESKEKR